MSRPTLYVWSVSLAGSGIILLSLIRVIWQPIDAAWLILGALVLLSGATVLRLRSVSASFSVGDAFSFAALFLYGPEAGTLTVALDALAISTRLKGSPTRVVFNSTAPSLAMWCAGTIVFRLAGLPLLSEAESIGIMIVAAAASTLIVFLVGSGFVAGAVAVHEHQPVGRVWREHFAQLWSNPIACGYAGALIAMSVHYIGLVAFVVVLPIPVILYYAFRTSLGRMDDHVRHLSEMNRTYQSTIEAFATAVDAKDQVTHGHIRRVQTYCLALARELGADDEATLKSLEAAALLHDVGKIGIPDHILNKPGRLTPAETEEMKQHVMIGANVLSTVDFPFPVVPIVKCHHESWDGSGYPEGLRGEEIPLGARILTVVDCFDALTSDRPYRAALSVEGAFEILRDRRGNMYDPRVVDAFIALQPRLTMPEVPADVPPSPSPRAASRKAPDPAEGARTELAQAIVRMLADALPGNLCVGYHTEGTSIVAGVAAGPGGAAALGHRMALGAGVSGWVAANRAEIVETDAALDFPGRTTEGAAALQRCTCVPLATAPPLVVTVYGPAEQTVARVRALRQLGSIVSHLTSPTPATASRPAMGLASPVPAVTAAPLLKTGVPTRDRPVTAPEAAALR